MLIKDSKLQDKFLKALQDLYVAYPVNYIWGESDIHKRQSKHNPSPCKSEMDQEESEETRVLLRPAIKFLTDGSQCIPAPGLHLRPGARSGA